MNKMSKKQLSPGLISNLQQLQAGFGWSQAKMAREIEVSTSLLSQVYSGKRTLGHSVIKGVAVRFPDLKEEVWLTLNQ